MQSLFPLTDLKAVLKGIKILKCVFVSVCVCKVTGDNVRSMVLCDFTGDGKNEVRFRFTV